jgi:hypothetical protein
MNPTRKAKAVTRTAVETVKRCFRCDGRVIFLLSRKIAPFFALQCRPRTKANIERQNGIESGQSRSAGAQSGRDGFDFLVKETLKNSARARQRGRARKGGLPARQKAL